MQDLLLEIKPKILDKNKLFEIQKNKNLLKNIWKTIGIVILLCVIIIAIFENSDTIFSSIAQYILLFSVVSSLILFFPTMISLNYFANGSSIGRNDCYIRVYSDRLECYQILSSVSREKEKAILYYDEMLDWNIKHREITNTSAKAKQINCIEINMDKNFTKSSYDNMQLYKFYIEMAGYDRNEFMKCMKVAYIKANEYKKIPYHTYSKDYYLE